MWKLIVQPLNPIPFSYDSIGYLDFFQSIFDVYSKKFFFWKGKLPPVNHLTLDKNQEYLVYSDADQIVWVYRLGLRGAANRKISSSISPIARLPMYGIVRYLRFSFDGRLLCANMNDCRLYSMLLVDPLRADHLDDLARMNSHRQALKLARQGNYSLLIRLSAILEW